MVNCNRIENNSKSASIKRFITSYLRARFDSMARYIHKYYLPLEMKQRILLADIQALKEAFDIGDVWIGNLSNPTPGCIVYYDDLCLEKAIPAHDVALVLQAIAAYSDDYRSDLTDDENRAAINFNTWLRDWEKNLLAECVRNSEEMNQRVRSGDPWLTEYEIELKVVFYVRDDDPFFDDNNTDDNNHDIDKDASLLCSTGLLMDGRTFVKEVENPDYWGIGDGKNHNDLHGLGLWRKSSIYEVEHCSTLHELYSLLKIPMKHMGRIGLIWTDINIYHQNFADVPKIKMKAFQQVTEATT